MDTLDFAEQVKQAIDTDQETIGELTIGALKLLTAIHTTIVKSKAFAIKDDKIDLRSSDILDAVEGNVTDASFRKWRSQANEWLANSASVKFSIKAHTRKAPNHSFLSLDINDEWLQANRPVPKNFIDQAKQASPEDGGLIPPTAYPQVTKHKVMVSHSWNAEDEVQNIVWEFLQALKSSLKTLPEDYRTKLDVELIYDQDAFNAHDTINSQQTRYCEAATMALVLWNDRYEHSSACQEEVDYFLTGEGGNRPNKTAVVILQRGNYKNMGGRYTKRLVQHASGKQPLCTKWPSMKQSEKDAFIDQIREKICQALIATPPPASSKSTAKNRHKQSEPDLAELGVSVPDIMMDATQQAANAEDHYGSNKLVKATAVKRRAGESSNSTEALPVVDELQKWASSERGSAPRVTALLGDFGFGKTVTCRALAKRLAEDFSNDPNGAPLPIYLDIKDLAPTIKNLLAKPIETLLEELQRKTGSNVIKGSQIIDYARNNRCLIIFDGFDEVAHKLNRDEQVRLYSNLLDIVPPAVYKSDAQRFKQVIAHINSDSEKKHTEAESSLAEFPSRILISCRTEFFHKHEQQTQFLEGNMRHDINQARSVGMSNIQQFYMAPFTRESIEKYLEQNLGEALAKDALHIIDKVHDLSELSSHPLILALISRHVPRLIVLSNQKQRINAATLYLQLFDIIGERDNPKHLIRLTDKQEMLAALALQLWRNRKTGFTFKRLDRWFQEYAAQHTTLSAQMSVSLDSPQQLVQDLCGASLLVRDSNDFYRFAHTSYFEFFIALGIFECIRTADSNSSFNILNNKMGATLNTETRRFLTDWRETCENDDREEFDVNFKQMLQKKSVKSNKQIGFGLWHFGGSETNDFPHSNACDFSGLSFDNSFVPARFIHSDFSRFNLENCHIMGCEFFNLSFAYASLTPAMIKQNFFYHCELNTNDEIDLSTTNHLQKRPTPRSQIKKSDLCGQNKPRLRESQLLNEMPFIQEAHTQIINSVALSADGLSLVSGSNDGTVKRWDVNSGECLHTFEGHTSAVSSVALSADGLSLVSGSHDNTVKRWDVNSGECLRTFEGHTSVVTSVTLSADGQSLVSCSDDKTVKRWDVNSGECLHTFEGHTSAVTSLALSADGLSLVTGSHDNTVKWWDVHSGECLRTFEGHTNMVASVALSADGLSLASGAYDKTVKRWDVNSGECLHTFQGHTSLVTSVALSADGLSLFSGSFDDTVKRWDVNSGECLNTFQGHTAMVASVALSADGLSLVSGTYGNTVKQWDVNSGECLHTFEGHRSMVSSVVLSADGLSLVSGSFDDTVKRWDVNSGECLRTFEGHTSRVTSVALSADGLSLVSGSDDNTVKRWDVNSGECLHTFEGHTSAVSSVALSADGLSLVSGSYDNTVKWWNVNSGECLHTFEGHTSVVISVTLSADGQSLVSGSYDNTVKRWDVNSGKCLHTFEGHKSMIRSVALSADGLSLVSGSDDNTVKRWDVNSGECLHTFEAHTGAVNSVALSADGLSLASGSDDNRVNLWNVLTEKNTLSILVDRHGSAVFKQGKLVRVVGAMWRFLFVKDGEGRFLPGTMSAHWAKLYRAR